jgi:hypothetical protein
MNTRIILDFFSIVIKDKNSICKIIKAKKKYPEHKPDLDLIIFLSFWLKFRYI